MVLRVFLSLFLTLNCASPLVAAGWDQYGDAISGAAITESVVLGMFFTVNAPLHIMNGLMTERNSVADNAARAAKKHSRTDKDAPAPDRVLIASGTNEFSSRSGVAFLSPAIGPACLAAGVSFPRQPVSLAVHRMDAFVPCMLLLFFIVLSLSNLPAASIVKNVIIGTRSINDRPGFLLEATSC